MTSPTSRGRGILPEPHRPRAVPFAWALVFAITCAIGCGAIGTIVGYTWQHAAPPERCYLDAVRVPIEGEVYSVRWIEDGIARQVMVEGVEARDRAVAWLRR